MAPTRRAVAPTSAVERRREGNGERQGGPKAGARAGSLVLPKFMVSTALADEMVAAADVAVQDNEPMPMHERATAYSRRGQLSPIPSGWDHRVGFLERREAKYRADQVVCNVRCNRWDARKGVSRGAGGYRCNVYVTYWKP